MPHPWAKLQSESEKAYSAFESYRLFGTNRSVDAAYQIHTGRKTRAPGTWGIWFRKYDWKSRAAAFDAHEQGIHQSANDRVTEIKAEKRARDIEAGQEQQIIGESEMLAFLRDRFNELKKFPFQKNRTAVSPDGRQVTITTAISSRELLQVIETYFRLGRQHNQMPDKVLEDASPQWQSIFANLPTDQKLADLFDTGAVPVAPPDPLEKPTIGAAARTADGDNKLTQPGIIRP